MYTYYPVPSEVKVNKGKENDKLLYLKEWTGTLMEVLDSSLDSWLSWLLMPQIQALHLLQE